MAHFPRCLRSLLVQAAGAGGGAGRVGAIRQIVLERSSARFRLNSLTGQYPQDASRCRGNAPSPVMFLDDEPIGPAGLANAQSQVAALTMAISRLS